MSASVATPLAGERFRVACQHPAKLDTRDRRLMALIGAYADAGVTDPPVRELARRLNATPEEIDAALQRLSRARLVWIDWAPFKRYRDACHPRARRRRNRYTCRFAGDPLPDRARAVIYRHRPTDPKEADGLTRQRGGSPHADRGGTHLHR